VSSKSDISASSLISASEIRVEMIRVEILCDRAIPANVISVKIVSTNGDEAQLEVVAILPIARGKEYKRERER
jgi:hypothetical protein